MRSFALFFLCLLTSAAVSAAPKPKSDTRTTTKAPKTAKAGSEPEFITIPGGEFHYGCEPKDQDCVEVEKPGSDVSQPGFEIMKTEVTVEMYRACVTAGKCEAPNGGQGGFCNWNEGGKDKFPIACVDQAQARAYCQFIGARLPHAQEWEFAAKSRGGRIYPWGNTPPDEKKAVFQQGDGSREVGTHPAGATKEGVQDMAGNLWEWTDDEFSEGLGEVRGGSWRNPGVILRASRRGRRPFNDRSDWLGMRCVK